jgi:hypothetical protein
MARTESTKERNIFLFGNLLSVAICCGSGFNHRRVIQACKTLSEFLCLKGGIHQAAIFAVMAMAISNITFLNRNFRAVMSISVDKTLFCIARTARANHEKHGY